MLCSRRKDPQKVRATLLERTAAIIAEQGLARVTVEAVAKAAGVTKGGLFHHFPNKQALIDGVVDTMIVDADAMVDQLMADDPEPHGRFTRALLMGVLGDPKAMRPAGAAPRTLCLAMLADPVLQRRWAGWIEGRVARHAETDDNLPCAMVRLASDGIWLSALHDAERPTQIDDTVRDALIAMTRPGP